ncbi:hypothetical protein TSMEX_005300 [Taenia solium]|eukprot:TsM_000920300 transcript=TsM_000920300 gene=TsM_000920300
MSKGRWRLHQERFIGLFILLIEVPFCCAFIPQTELITRAVDKMGQLPIAIACIIVGIIAIAMCHSISMVFALLFLLASAAIRIREFILASMTYAMSQQMLIVGKCVNE